MFRNFLKALPLASIILCTGCVVRPAGPPAVVVGGPPVVYARPAPPPAYAWYRPGWRRW